MGFSSEPGSVAEARRAVTDMVHGWGADVDLDVLRLVTSELITNAVQHGEPPIRLSIEWQAHELRVGVSDGSLVASDPSAPVREDAESGRGRQIMGELTLAWGVHRHVGAKTVWFTLPVAGAAPWAWGDGAGSGRSRGRLRIRQP
jgi:anti-sigma regulatory factor (Ser/Thr protein kinase)